MTKDEAIKFFGTQARLAAALFIKQPSVAEWGEYPPPERQLAIQELTGGKLKAELPPKARERILGNRSSAKRQRARIDP